MISCGVIFPKNAGSACRRNASEGIRNNAKIRDKVRRLATLSLYVGSACFASASGTVTLAWDPNPSPGTAGYMLYYGNSSGVYTNVVDVRRATTNTVSGLVDGATYFFVVTAYNVAGLESDFSAELKYRYTSNSAPTLAPIANMTINEDAGPQTVTLRGIGTGASNEIQTLVVTAQSGNPTVITTPLISYNSPNSTGTLTFSPLPNASGSATITVMVNDGQPQRNLTSQSFVVTVVGVNDPSAISSIPNQTITKFAATAAIPFIIGDPETPAENLIVSANSSNPLLVPLTQIAFGGSGSNRTVKVTPTSGLTGVATITLSVGDGVTTASTAFVLSVTDNTRILSANSAASTGFTLRWASSSGMKYRVAYKDRLEDPNWTDLSGDIIANGFISSWSDPSFGRSPTRFYKVRPLQ